MPTRKIREVIEHQRILTCTGDVSVGEATRRMVAAHVSSVMVVEGARLVGIFTERDALSRVLAEGLDPEATPLFHVMTPDPQTVSPDVPLGHALHMMYEGGFRHVPVLECGHPVGMISARDALGLEMVAFEQELRQRDVITRLL